MTDTLTVGFFWLLIGVIAAAMFGVMLARSWRRAGRPHGVAATHCDVLGHDWGQWYGGYRLCLGCGRREDRPVYDQELHPDTDLGKWEAES